MWNMTRKKIIQVPIEEELLESVDTYARQAGKSRAAFIREACAEYITRSDEEELHRRDIEGYTKYPERVSPAEDEWRMKNAAEVWGEEDFSDWDPPND